MFESVCVFVPTAANCTTDHTNPIILDLLTARATRLLSRSNPAYPTRMTYRHHLYLLFRHFCILLWYSRNIRFQNLQTFLTMRNLHPPIPLLTQHSPPLRNLPQLAHNPHNNTLHIKNNTIPKLNLHKLIKLLSQRNRLKHNHPMLIRSYTILLLHRYYQILFNSP